MEIVAPAGNLQKLSYAWEYGADAAYIGLKDFSLRVKADNFHGDEHLEIARYKARHEAEGATKRLFCALNVSCTDADIDRFLSEIDYFKAYPFDAFIVQDMGLVDIIQSNFPGAALHLSTQASCLNSRAVKAYRDLGFRRVVLAREASLSDVKRIKDAAPDVEIECFAHGAMCIAYSGRCLMSAYMTGRSANKGSCTHSCRWDWRVLEERERPGEYYPVIEDGGFTSVFSSRDLCMIGHLREMRDAGIDSLKIEGRMKSLYYAAAVSRAYRKALDLLEGRISETEARPFIDELENVPHREYGTGFYFKDGSENKTTGGLSSSSKALAGTIGKRLSDDGLWEFIPMTKVTAHDELDAIGPDVASVPIGQFTLHDPATGAETQWTSHHHGCAIKTKAPLRERYIVRLAEKGPVS